MMDAADTQNLNLLEEIEDKGELENPWPHIDWESLPSPFYGWQIDTLPIESA
ncbi:MAG: hypothetical protein U7123_18000 [Potamolinea sp.]